MLEHGGLQIFSGHPIRERAGIYREMAGLAWNKAKKRIDAFAEDGLELVCAKVSRIIAAEERAEKEWARLSGKKINDLRFSGALEILVMTKWELQNPSVRIEADEFVLPKPPRGSVLQNASGWYDRCGSPRCPM